MQQIALLREIAFRHQNVGPDSADAALRELFKERDDLLAACKAAYSLIGQQWAGPSLDVSNQLAAAIARAESGNPVDSPPVAG